MTKRFNTFAYIIFFVVFFVAYWYRLYVQDLIPIDGNSIRLFYPAWQIGKRLFFSGFYFLWDPYRNMGQPFLADPQNQAIYFINLLTYFFDYLTSVKISILIHTILVALPSYLIGRRHYKNRESAIMLSFALGFNGLFLSRVTLQTHFATMAWIPMLLFLIDRQQSILLGIALTMEWMAGFPPFFILSLIILLFFLLANDHSRQKARSIVIAGFVMLGLSAVQWLPFIEMLQASVRPFLLSVSESSEYSIHPLEWVRQSLLPSVLMGKYKPITISDPAMTGFYFGPILLILVGVGLWKGKKKEWMFLSMAIMGSVLAFGQYNFLYKFILIFRIFRFPCHWILLSVIGFSFLGSRGLDRINNGSLRKWVLGLFLLDLFMLSVPLRTTWADLTFLSQTPLRIKGLNEIPIGSRIFHTKLIAEKVHLWKIQTKEDWLILKGCLVPSIGSAYGISEALSYDVLVSKKLMAYYDRLNRNPPDSTLFDYACISKIISITKEGYVKPVPGWKDLGVFENKDYKSVLFTNPVKTMDMIKNNPGDIAASLEGPCDMVLSETYYDGWHASVDKEIVTPALFENIFPTIHVSDGKHSVHFRYVPFTFKLGLTISLITILGLLISLIYMYLSPRD